MSEKKKATKKVAKKAVKKTAKEATPKPNPKPPETGVPSEVPQVEPQMVDPIAVINQYIGQQIGNSAAQVFNSLTEVAASEGMTAGIKALSYDQIQIVIAKLNMELDLREASRKK